MQLKNRKNIHTAIQITLLAIGIMALALGVYLGEAAEVMYKAVVVCMECIGIG